MFNVFHVDLLNSHVSELMIFPKGNNRLPSEAGFSGLGGRRCLWFFSRAGWCDAVVNVAAVLWFLDTVQLFVVDFVSPDFSLHRVPEVSIHTCARTHTHTVI